MLGYGYTTSLAGVFRESLTESKGAMRRSLFAAGLGIVVGCSSEPSGVLTITLTALPEFTADTSIQVSGTITRTPPSKTAFVVTIAGGVETVTDTVAGSFDATVRLIANQENQLAITAFDGTGAVADPLIAVIVHDATGPQVATSIPADRQSNVALNTAIELRFAEALVQTGPSASFTLTQNSRTVPGTAVLSGDQTFFTFQPDQALQPHSIYEMELEGFTDAAGNPTEQDRDVCFITTSEGLATSVSTDTSDTFFTSPTAARDLIPPNMVGASLARSGNTLYGLFEFGRERSLNGDQNKASIFVDIDLDSDPTTGFQGFKDFQLANITDAARFSTRLGTELMISLDANVVATNGFVGVTTADVTWDEIDVFLPGVCGRFFGFHTTTVFDTPLGDDGRFNYAYSAFAIEDTAATQTAVFMDPVPLAGHIIADLSSPGPPALQPLTTPSATTHPRQIKAVYHGLLRLLRLR